MRQRNFSRIFRKAEAKEREGIFKITGKGSSKCMEEFRESCPHSDCKAKLGEPKGLGCSGIKDNGRGVKVGVLKGSKVNKGMSSRFRLPCDGSVRQHDSPVLPENGRLPSLCSARKFDRGDLPFSGRSGYLSAAHSPEGEDKCTGRPGFQEGSHLYGVGPRQHIFPVVLSGAGGSTRGFVRHEAEQKTPFVCFLLSRPRSIRLGCSGEMDQLEPMEVSIPLSSLSGVRGSDWLAEILQRGRIFDCSFLTNSALVS